MLQWHTLNFKSLGAVLPYHTLYQNYCLKHLIITAGFLPVPYVVLSRMTSLWKQLTHAASSVTQPSWRTFRLSMRVIKVCDVCIVSLERNHSKRGLEGFQKHRSHSGLILSLQAITLLDSLLCIGAPLFYRSCGRGQSLHLDQLSTAGWSVRFWGSCSVAETNPEGQFPLGFPKRSL